MFFVRVVVGEPFTGRANVNVLLRHVTEVLFAEPPSDVDARGHRLGQRDRDARFLARQNLLAVEVAAIGDGIEVLHFQRRLRPLGHGRKLRPVVTDVGHLMRDDQMMLGVDRDLDVVADDTGALAARRHRAGIGICQRYLLVRCGEHFHLENLETLHLLLQLLDLLFQAARLGLERLGRLLPVGSVELLQIARDALLDLRHASVHLGAREVLIAVVHRLELAAVDRDAGFREQGLIVRHSAMKRAHTSRMAVPLSLRKSAMVL